MSNEYLSKNGKQTEPTYINLAKGFYALGFPHYITPQGVAVFHAILYRANELRFPQTIRISNTELCGNAGDLKCNSFRKVRDQLCEFEHDGKKLLSYTPEPNQRAGWYEINYKLLLGVFCDITAPDFIAEEPIDDQTVTKVGLNCDQTVTKVGLNCDQTVTTKPVFEHDLRQDKTRQDKTREEKTRSSSSSSKDIVVQEEDDEENISERYNEFKITQKLIEKHYDENYFLNKGLMPLKRKMMKDIGEYPEERIVSAIEQVGMKLKNSECLIQFVHEELEKDPIVKEHVYPERDPDKVEQEKIEIIYVNLDRDYFSETKKMLPLRVYHNLGLIEQVFEIFDKHEGWEERYKAKYPDKYATMTEMLEYAKNNLPKEQNEYTRKAPLISEDV